MIFKYIEHPCGIVEADESLQGYLTIKGGMLTSPTDRFVVESREILIVFWPKMVNWKID